MEKEYFYIDFKDKDIYSYTDEGSDLDKANKEIGNCFESFIEAKQFLKAVLAQNVIADKPDKKEFIDGLLYDYDLVETDKQCMNNISDALLEATQYNNN